MTVIRGPDLGHAGAARLPDTARGRSKQVFKTTLDAQGADFREGIYVVAMDRFIGFKTVAAAGDAWGLGRQRVEQDTLVHRRRSGEPSYGPGGVKRTGADLLTDKHHERLKTVFTGDEHAQGEATWRISQKVGDACRIPTTSEGEKPPEAVITPLRRAVPDPLHELISLSRLPIIGPVTS